MWGRVGVVKSATVCFQDNDDMDAAALGGMLGMAFKSNGSQREAMTAKTAKSPPLFLRRLHGVLRRVVGPIATPHHYIHRSTQNRKEGLDFF